MVMLVPVLTLMACCSRCLSPDGIGRSSTQCWTDWWSKNARPPLFSLSFGLSAWMMESPDGGGQAGVGPDLSLLMVGVRLVLGLI